MNELLAEKLVEAENLKIKIPNKLQNAVQFANFAIQYKITPYNLARIMRLVELIYQVETRLTWQKQPKQRTILGNRLLKYRNALDACALQYLTMGVDYSCPLPALVSADGYRVSLPEF